MKISHLLWTGMLMLGLSGGDAAARDFRPVWVIDPNKFAAIAYSPSTGKYGYSYNYASRSAAEKVALQHLPQPDARIVCWVQAGFCALALGDDKSEFGVGWSYGKGARTEDAREGAVNECGKKTTNPHLVLLLLSDGQLVWDHAPDSTAAQTNGTPTAKQIGKLSPSMLKSLESKTDNDGKTQSSPENTNSSVEQPNTKDKQTEQKGSLADIFQFGKPPKTNSARSEPNTNQAKESATTSSWQTSWDGFLTVVEQELNRLPPNAAGPWEGKEVTWEGTVNDIEVMMAKNLVRLVVDMPERTLTIKGEPVAASRLMIFVPMQYENLAAAKKGATVRFKTTIAPMDATHPAVSAQPGKNGAKGFLLIFTKGGTLLK